jgi:L-seryl-tRNA(Ser) seleniumtransferase
MSTVPSGGLALAPKGGGRALDRLATALRRLPVPVIGRIEDGALVLDLRCLEDETGFAANLANFDPAPGGRDSNEMA